MRRSALVLSALLLGAVSAGAATSPTPQALLEQMKAWLEPSMPSSRQFTMTVRSAPGDAVEWKAAQARGTIDDSNFALTVLLDPPDVRGTALLVQEQKGKPNSEWLYVPSLRRVRRLLPVDEFQSFLNTEFTDSDLGFVNLKRRKIALRDVPPVNGREAYGLEEVPDDQQTFKRIVTWLAKDTKQPLKREYYDVANRLWKVQTFADVATFPNVSVAQRVVIEDVQTGYGSEYRLSALNFTVQIPPELFDWQQLPKAADHPFWADSITSKPCGGACPGTPHP